MVEVGADGVWREDGDEVSLSPGRGLPGCDVVFPVLHGPFGEDGTVQGLLEMPRRAVRRGRRARLGAVHGQGHVQAADGARGDPPGRLPGGDGVASGLRAREAALADLAALGLPVFVKPARLGSSVGIGRVGERRTSCRRRLELAFAHDSLAIVEALATGIEVECSVLGNDEPIASQPGEILLAAGEAGLVRLRGEVHARRDGADRARAGARRGPRAGAVELAVETFVKSGCRGLARVDFFVDGEQVLVNELNTMPGFTSTSVYAALFEASGVPYVELLDRLLALAVEAHEAEGRVRH